MANRYADLDGVPPIPLPPSAINYPYLHKAFANVLGGVSNAKCLLVGDSVLFGYAGSGNQPTMGRGPALNLVTVLQGLTGANTAIGLAVPKVNGSIGNDARWTVGTGWQLNAGVGASSWGGLATGYIGTVAASGNLVYTPGTNCDTFDIYYLKNAGTGSVNAQATGGSSTPINMVNASRSIGKTTVTAASLATNNTLTFSTVATGNVQIIGVEAYDSTRKQWLIGNGSAVGATAAGWIGGAGVAGNDPRSAITAYAPDFSIISLGINDAFLTYTNAQYQANMTSLIATCKASGDVLLMSPSPCQNAPDNRLAGCASYVAPMADFARANGVAFYDHFTSWGGLNAFNVLNPLGFYTDNYHPALGGYYDMGRSLAACMADL